MAVLDRLLRDGGHYLSGSTLQQIAGRISSSVLRERILERQPLTPMLIAMLRKEKLLPSEAAALIRGLV